MITDRNGKPIEVGMRVVVNVPEYGECWVRKYSKCGTMVRVDDGDEHDTDLTESKSWSWSAWVVGEDVEVLDSRLATRHMAEAETPQE